MNKKMMFLTLVAAAGLCIPVMADPSAEQDGSIKGWLAKQLLSNGVIKAAVQQASSLTGATVILLAGMCIAYRLSLWKRLDNSREYLQQLYNGTAAMCLKAERYIQSWRQASVFGGQMATFADLKRGQPDTSSQGTGKQRVL